MKEIISEKHGRLTLIEVLPNRTGDGHKVGEWVCDCGKTVHTAISRVRHGYTKSCGCFAREAARSRNQTHGMRGSTTYSSWRSMLDRCLNASSKDYPRYGGRGILVCEDWAGSFEVFLRDVGERPQDTTLDRVNTLGNYEPGNVRWATRQTQQRNRASAYRWHIKGHSFETHSEAAEHFGVSEHTIWRWVNGQFDKRRNTFTAAREDCHVIARY